MLIEKDYKIETDDMNVTISQRIVSRKGKNAGKETWVNRAYVSTLQNALKWFVDQGVRETGLTDLKTVIKKQEELYALIEGIK